MHKLIDSWTSLERQTSNHDQYQELVKHKNRKQVRKGVYS